MLRFLAQRLLFFLCLYLFASLAIFAAIEAMPGDPVALRFGKRVDPNRVALERERLGLDQAWWTRYLRSQESFLSGDWGRSLSSGRETVRDVWLHLPATLELSAAALALGASGGLALALCASTSDRPWLRRLANGVGALGLVVPIFWIGIMLLLVGALWLGWFPMGGRFDLSLPPPEERTGLLLLDSLLDAQWEALAGALRHLALPALCLAFYPAATVTTVAFARLREPELRAMATALKARGYARSRIICRHLLRVAAAPVVTVVGTSFGALLGGAFLTETVFSWPGIGRYLVTAILARDVFVAQNLLTFLVLLVIAIAFVADLVVWRLDPRSREGEGAQ